MHGLGEDKKSKASVKKANVRNTISSIARAPSLIIRPLMTTNLGYEVPLVEVQVLALCFLFNVLLITFISWIETAIGSSWPSYEFS
jgi:hypothetical protein